MWYVSSGSRMRGDAYELRGWCALEKICSFTKAEVKDRCVFIGLEKGKKDWQLAPVTPEDFAEQLQRYHFTKPEQDAVVVRELQRVIFIIKAEQTTTLEMEIQPHQLAPLCNALPHYPELKTLNLSGSPGLLPDAGAARHLTQALSGAGAVLLSLYCCELCDAAVRALAPLVTDNAATIDIEDNPAVSDVLKEELIAAGLADDDGSKKEGGCFWWNW